MCAFHFECSSRKNRDLPLWGAFGRGRAGCTEKVSDGQKLMRHNKGLCLMGTGGMGGGSNSQSGTGRLGLRLRVLRNFIRNGEKLSL